jgi:L-threonylcarbamoyladenylate synthase
MAGTKVLRVDPLNPDVGAIEEAAGVLRAGGLVAFPTETVYGLGADAFNVKAVLRVFEVKARPPDNPLIVHVSGIHMLEEVSADVPEEVLRVLEVAWPGPLTVVLRRSSRLPSVVSGGLDTVAVRAPAHPVALKLIESFGRPVAAPSANLSGRPSPTTAKHVLEDLGGRVDLVLDAGETFFGVESTVVDVLRDPPRVLRPGPIGPEELERLFGKPVEVPDYARGLELYSGAPPSPGLKYRHYAPEKSLLLVERGSCSDRDYLEYLKGVATRLATLGVALIASSEVAGELGTIPGVEVIVLGSRANLYEVAKNLYTALRGLDRFTAASVGLAEAFEERGIGLAVMNRLRKASSRRLVCGSTPPPTLI